MGVYEELVNRWIKLTGTADPNSVSAYDIAPIGTAYVRTGTDPTIQYTKNRTGANGWNEFSITGVTTVNRIVYADAGYAGLVPSDGSQAHPFSDPQEAIDFAESLSPTVANPVTIKFRGHFVLTTELIVKGESLVLQGDGYAFLDGFLAGLTYGVVVTNATKSSWTTYKAGGYSDYSLLVNDGAGPQDVIIQGLVTWGLGLFGVAGDDGPGLTNFANGIEGILIQDVDSTYNSSIYIRNANYVRITRCSLIGAIHLTNVASLETSFLNVTQNCLWVYDPADPAGQPSTATSGSMISNYCIFPIVSCQKDMSATFRFSSVATMTASGDTLISSRMTRFSNTMTLNDRAGVTIGTSFLNNVTVNGSGGMFYAIDNSFIAGNVTDPNRLLAVSADSYLKRGQLDYRLLDNPNLKQNTGIGGNTQYEIGSAFSFSSDGYIYTKTAQQDIAAIAGSSTGVGQYRAVTFSTSITGVLTQTVSALKAVALVQPPAPPAGNTPFAVVQIPASFSPGVTPIQNAWITQGFRIKG